MRPARIGRADFNAMLQFGVQSARLFLRGFPLQADAVDLFIACLLFAHHLVLLCHGFLQMGA
jgi:hypothetical protein